MSDFGNLMLSIFDEPVICDICNQPQHDGEEGEDWNGETGNHLSCEEEESFNLGDAMALRFGTDEPKEKPKLQLSGQDGNAFFIIGRALEVLRKAGYTKEERDKFEQEVTSGDYDNVLATCMRWFDVS